MRETPSTQRYHGVWNFMRSFRADPAGFSFSRRIHPALTSFADEVSATLARLIAYLMILALVAVLGLYGWDQLPPTEASEPATKLTWAVAGRSHPSFTVSRQDTHKKTETYEIFRHPEGGRKEIFRWTDQAGKPAAELEIYRPGGEADAAADARADLAAQMPFDGGFDLETAGVIDSKFGNIALFRPAGVPDGVGSCLGFLKQIGDPPLRIAGWSCQGPSTPVRRAAIGCLLNRLTLLASGNDPKMAEFFARAELRRGTCAGSAPPAQSADWVTRTENPRLHGAF
jgi:hypothetical protein